MKEIIAYEMIYNKALEYQNDIVCVPFQEKYWNEYMKIYNECFYKMREALEVEPINFYHDYSQIKDKINDIFLYIMIIILYRNICSESRLKIKNNTFSIMISATLFRKFINGLSNLNIFSIISSQSQTRLVYTCL